ncbi:hypothetical protein P4311_27920 [Bacillus thuringiensis]|nr:hypothetical protein [Bacillus thuringiensis]MRB61164.1 hypothetical protein [Bacillus thuringiensis]
MKKKFIFFTLVLLFLSTSFLVLINVEAETIDQIPERMNPGTIIKYVEDNKYIFIKQGKPLSEDEQLPEVKFEDPYRPLAKKGVEVEYGFNGLVNMVKGVKYGEEMPGVLYLKYGSVVQPDARDGELVKGNISHYNGNVDERGFELGKYGCAVQQTIDNPPYGATIIVKNLANNKVAFLKKRDVGRLHPSVVLDIRPHVFKDVLGAPLTQGWIKGVYFHD